MQIDDNYLNAWHLPPERPRIDGHAVHHTQVTWGSIPCHNGRIWHLAIPVSFPTPPARRPPTSLTATAVGGVDDRPQRLAQIWLQCRCTLLTIFFTKSISAIRRRQHSSMLWCCRFLMSDVYIGPTLLTVNSICMIKGRSSDLCKTTATYHPTLLFETSGGRKKQRETD